MLGSAAMADDPPKVPADLIEALEKMADDLPALPNNDEASRRFEWLLDALILRGQVPDSFRRLAKRVQAERGVKIRLAPSDDKYSVESPDVDCATLIPLCGARCCSFNVALSNQDVVERKLPFVVDEPYMLPRDPVTKRCTCMNAAGACTVYEVRPSTCRTYDCREDRRVWLDYEARIPAPLPESVRPLTDVFLNKDDE